MSNAESLMIFMNIINSIFMIFVILIIHDICTKIFCLLKNIKKKKKKD